MPFLYQPGTASIPYGQTPFTAGWDANSRRNSKVADDRPATASGYFLRPNGALINLWITDIQASFAVSGQAAQSRMLRQFYPRSFSSVTLSITGNVPNTQEYNRLALFVREHQYLALQGLNGGSTIDQTIVFALNDQTPSSWPANPHNVKGAHVPWHLRGYVKSMAAGAVRHEVAPEFTVDFLVAASTFQPGAKGLWGEQLASPASLSNFLRLVNVASKQDRVPGGLFVKDPLQKATPAAATPPAPPASPVTQVPGLASLWSALTQLNATELTTIRRATQ